MHASFHIFVNRGLVVSLIRFSDSRTSNLKRHSPRRRNTTRPLAASVRRSCPIDRIRSKHSARKNLRPDLIRKVRWRSSPRILYVSERASIQRHWRSQWPDSRRALLVAHAPCTTSSKAVLISRGAVILAILSAIFFAISQSLAQEISLSQSPPLTDKQTFQQIEDRWCEAINRRDQYALELVLSPEMIDISASGTVTTRDQQIAMLLQRRNEPLLLNQGVVNVRSFGEIAIVIGNYVEQPRAKEKMVRRGGMFTHVFRKFRGRWSCINAQRTANGDPSPQKTRRAER
jgi:hypothetical protein